MAVIQNRYLRVTDESTKNSNWMIYILLGISATMPIVNIPKSNISIFSIILPICIVVNILLISDEIKVTSNIYLLFGWLLCMIISCLLGFIYFSSSIWSQAALSYVPKIILYFVFAVTLAFTKKKTTLEFILKGLFIGAILNLVFASLDAVLFYITGNSIANILFKNYIIINNIRYGQVSLITNGTIRSSGFNYDPSHIGLLAPVVFFVGLYKKQIFLIILAIISILASMSTTALVGCLIMALFLFSTRKKQTKKKLSLKYMFFLMIVLLLIFLGVIIFSNSIINYIEIVWNTAKNMFSRVDTVYVNGAGDGLRNLYHKYIFSAIQFIGLGILFGTGLNTSSYGFVENKMIAQNFSEIPRPYDVESTYISFFLDTGIIGFILFMWILIYLFKRYMRDRDKNDFYMISFAFIMSLIIAQTFYHYTMSAVQILIIITCFIYTSNFKMDNENNKFSNKAK